MRYEDWKTSEIPEGIKPPNKNNRQRHSQARAMIEQFIYSGHRCVSFEATDIEGRRNITSYESMLRFACDAFDFDCFVVRRKWKLYLVRGRREDLCSTSSPTGER